MSTRGFAVVLAIVLALAIGAAAASPDVRVSAVEAGVVLDVEIEGVLVDVTTARLDDGRRVVWMLLDPPLPEPEPDEGDDEDASSDDESEPTCPATEPPPSRRLARLEPFDEAKSPRGALQVVASGIAARWIEAVDLDGDGADELLAGVDDRLERFDADGSTTVLVDPALDDGRPVLVGPGDGPAWIRLAGVGRDRYLRYDPEAGAAVEAVTIDNRTRVARHPGGLVVWSPSVMPVPGADGPLLAGWPELTGGDRVQVDLVRPDAATPEARRVDCWGRLPADERPIERFVRLLDGEPVAIVTTIPAGGLNLFGEKRLRIWPLRRDRSRRGVSPLLAVETRVNVWQSIEPVLHDVDGDGQTDLVLAYWKGLKDDRVVLDAYTRNRAGGFELRPRGIAFDVKNGDRSFVLYGPDPTGDGVPDLVVSGDGALRLFAGTSKGSKLVRRPAASVVEIGSCEDGTAGVEIGVAGTGGAFVRTTGAAGPPIPVDLDGDGADELVVRRGACDGPPLSVVRFAVPDRR